MTVQVAGAGVSSIINPRGPGIGICAGYSQSIAPCIRTGKEIDQVRVAGRAVRVVTVYTGFPVINYMLAVWERLISKQASLIMALHAEAS